MALPLERNKTFGRHMARREARPWTRASVRAYLSRACTVSLTLAQPFVAQRVLSARLPILELFYSTWLPSIRKLVCSGSVHTSRIAPHSAGRFAASKSPDGDVLQDLPRFNPDPCPRDQARHGEASGMVLRIECNTTQLELQLCARCPTTCAFACRQSSLFPRESFPMGRLW
jgi:hypothetical protein